MTSIIKNNTNKLSKKKEKVINANYFENIANNKMYIILKQIHRYGKHCIYYQRFNNLKAKFAAELDGLVEKLHLLTKLEGYFFYISGEVTKFPNAFFKKKPKPDVPFLMSVVHRYQDAGNGIFDFESSKINVGFFTLKKEFFSELFGIKIEPYNVLKDESEKSSGGLESIDVVINCFVDMNTFVHNYDMSIHIICDEKLNTFIENNVFKNNTIRAVSIFKHNKHHILARYPSIDIEQITEVINKMRLADSEHKD